jgi:hypothetical protein
MISVTPKIKPGTTFIDLNNAVNYALGFLDGAKAGKSKFLASFGSATIEVLKQYIDSHARSNPELLHHVYEWNQTGSPSSRLFDLSYKVTGLGLSINSTFRQSTSIKSGSNVPFYDKARIMENGIPVRISPKRSSVLVFEENGETVFTSKEVVVENPGGRQVEGSFEKIFDSFFNSYFSQSFLQSSGIAAYLERPAAFKKNFSKAKVGGKTLGVSTGYSWIVGAGGLS